MRFYFFTLFPDHSNSHFELIYMYGNIMSAKYVYGVERVSLFRRTLHSLPSRSEISGFSSTYRVNNTFLPQSFQRDIRGSSLANYMYVTLTLTDIIITITSQSPCSDTELNYISKNPTKQTHNFRSNNTERFPTRKIIRHRRVSRLEILNSTPTTGVEVSPVSRGPDT